MPRLSKIGAAALAAFGWTGLSSVTASYLVVAGGGGGGGILTNGSGGGGGAGGLLSGTTSLNPTQSYTVTVGAGGTASVSGSNSIFNAITSTGGGGGAEVGGNNAYTGGSGGGGAGTNTSPNNAGAAGTSGQGNTGGTGGLLFGTTRGGGGGGGSSAVGANQNGSGAAGAGGAGTEWPTSSGVFYAGGGGGGGTTGGAGGTGGGANGASSGTSPAPSGTANLGGGGGGGDQTSGNRYGGSGGSGVVIISYPAPQQFGGGVVTTSGSNVIHTFNTSGTLSPLSALTANYLVVAGGAGGGNGRGGGGGAGGMRTYTGLTIDTNSIYLVTVGAGGSGASTTSTKGASGGDSFFSTITSAGGGGGGSEASQNGNAGGSGGGAATNGAGGTQGFGGAGNTPSTSPVQGYAGGDSLGLGANPNNSGAGGGGAGGIGATVTTQPTGGNGGIGATWAVNGVTYAGGGGGGAFSTSYAGGTGGSSIGGAGAGSVQGATPGNGTANTGSGGGGSTGASGGAGGNGGGGVVIISYAGSTQQMAGGTVTITGGNVIHTFTSSGYLTPIKYVNNSLRFRSSASAYLSKTYGTSPTSRTTMTMSAWVKRGKPSDGTNNQAIFGTANNYENVTFNTDDTIRFTGPYSSSQQGIYVTTQKFRDYSAWYHIVVVYDTTNATATNRMRLYVNGVQVTSFSTQTTSNQNNTTTEWLNSGAVSEIGQTGAGNYFDGYLTEINVIDGQALTPNSFGTINSYGVWQPITYGGSYGTNGFYLPFTGGSSYYGSFNGSNQYLQATLPATLTGAFTIEAFVYRNSLINGTMFTLGDSNTSTGLEMYIGTSGTLYQIYSAGPQISTTSPVPTVTGWSHVAVTRDSSNVVRLFLNGAQIFGTWTTSAAFSSTLRIGVEYYGGALNSNWWNGNMSNFRIINGTALYTGPYSPPTSALTAVSGTSILTLQSSTIIDNSGNSLSITNNNTVTTTQAYPFTMLANQSKDYSPQGNNWTNNNIGVLSGSTLDVMTDVPTLTSATAANYATMNPLAYGSTGTSVMSNANLSLSNGVAHASTTSTIGVTSGKYYLECTVTTSSALGLGITTSTVPYSAYPGAVAGLWWVYDNTGGWNIFSQTSTLYSGASKVALNQIWQIALDMDNGNAWIGINNTWYDSAGGTTGNPSTGANPTWSSLPTTSPMFFFMEVAGAAWAATFGQRPYNYTAPTGFVGLNTYNL